MGLAGPGTTASFIYDPFGRRASKQINGQLAEYLYDGVDIAKELRTQGPVNYLRTLETDEVLVRGGIEHYLSDALRSTIVLTDSAGTVQTQYTYEPFGRTAVGGISTNPFQYTGRENDETGLYYYRARYYRPALHRFLGEDPLRFGGGEVNFYNYVGNSITNFIDPSGLEKTPASCPVVGHEPQRLHSYSYVTNNPLRFVDSYGLQPVDYSPSPEEIARREGLRQNGESQLTAAEVGVGVMTVATAIVCAIPPANLSCVAYSAVILVGECLIGGALHAVFPTAIENVQTGIDRSFPQEGRNY